jgi:hypothetical protein
LADDSLVPQEAPPANADPATKSATAPIMVVSVEMRFMLALLMGFRQV